MLSQTVLLKGINDTPDTLADLLRALVETRIKPYYLHQLDPAPGTSHFRVSIGQGQALMRALRGRLSGLAQPAYVFDIPGGHGKVPIGPQYLSGDATTVTDPRGSSTGLANAADCRRARPTPQPVRGKGASQGRPRGITRPAAPCRPPARSRAPGLDGAGPGRNSSGNARHARP